MLMKSKFTTLLTIGGLMMIMRLDWADQVAIEACKKASIFFLLVSFLQYSCCTVKRTLSCENPAKACVRNYRYIRYAYIQNLLQCNLDLVTLLVSAKTVTKLNDFM